MDEEEKQFQHRVGILKKKKKKNLERRYTIPENRNSLDRFNSRLDRAKDRFGAMKNRST